MRGQQSKLIFIDSSVATDSQDHTRVLVPPTPFSAGQHERMSLTLVSFSCRRNWYNIHRNNSIFYLYVDGASYHQVAIAPGVYPTFALLAAAIHAAILVTITPEGLYPGVPEIAAVAVTHSAVSRFFSIALTMAAGSELTPVEIRCFAVKSGALPAGVSLVGGFNDSFEILGATPIREPAAAAASLDGAFAAGVHTLTSRYPASLNTLDAIYLHLNTVQTGNFMSTGHDSHTRESPRLIDSDIFARIPFDDSTFTESHEVVQFEDSGGDMYQSMLNRKNLETLSLRVTDARGRSLATMNPNQARDGLLAYKVCLRWDLFALPPPKPPPRPPLDTAHHHPPHK